MNLLEVEALTAGYSTPVVGPLSLSLKRGEVVGVTGPNGVGKSTFLAALTGGARIFSGKIGKCPGLRISLQQQRPPAVEGIPFCATDLLALTGADPEGLPPWFFSRLSARLDKLSGGQLHFFMLWACLRAPADVVLLDEPTNNLDPESVAFLKTVLLRTKAEGSSLLVVSHERDFMGAVCDREVSL
ncbi:MAG: ATP-binding cassette domain-containing protein [Candidatus Accumulibacter sp.]|jgi:ATPase subunit of ABC transporter with duplicated ATPase domains|nr:ATP-binding cassette domain-containing protein [Accumulibacter sp.]